MATAQKSGVALADCLGAWARGEDGLDARAGAMVVAEVLLLIRGALRR